MREGCWFYIVAAGVIILGGVILCHLNLPTKIWLISFIFSSVGALLGAAGISSIERRLKRLEDGKFIDSGKEKKYSWAAFLGFILVIAAIFIDKISNTLTQ